MATDVTIKLPDDLLAELREKAAAEGKTVDQLAEEALRVGLKRRPAGLQPRQAAAYVGAERS